MLRNSGRKWSRFSGGRDRESRWDNTNFPHSRSGNARNDPQTGDFRAPGDHEQARLYEVLGMVYPVVSIPDQGSIINRV